MIKIKIQSEGKVRTFGKMTDYYNYLARKHINPDTGKHYKSYLEQNKYNIAHRTNPNTRKKFKSQNAYDKYIARKREKTEKNQRFGQLIQNRIYKMEISQAELARAIGTSNENVSNYALGTYLPRRNMQVKLCRHLKIPIKALERILGN